MKREKYGGAQVLRTKLLNWKNYFLDLEMDHYEGLKICNNKIWELQDELEWSKKNGRNIETGEGKMNQQEREVLQLRNRLRKIEEDFKITSEKLESKKEERVELGRVYNHEKRNAEQLKEGVGEDG